MTHTVKVINVRLKVQEGRKEGQAHLRERGQCLGTNGPTGFLLQEGKGREGKGREGKGREGTGRDGTGRDGTGRDGTGRDGTGRDGTGREGKEGK
jgi:hypothetical protein